MTRRASTATLSRPGEPVGNAAKSVPRSDGGLPGDGGIAAEEVDAAVRALRRRNPGSVFFADDVRRKIGDCGLRAVDIDRAIAAYRPDPEDEPYAELGTTIQDRPSRGRPL